MTAVGPRISKPLAIAAAERERDAQQRDDDADEGFPVYRQAAVDPIEVDRGRAPARAVPVRAISEPGLQATTEEWFGELERKLTLRKTGIDVSWLLDWAKKYCWSFLVRDMSLNRELYTADVRYIDVTTLWRTIVGINEFVKYNFAFFDAIPDWRYDPARPTST
uniref:hypothetical protein n=1 Tax=Nocardia abscessus TaxID=120957 RepID=UPI001E618D8D|nr:hypothetical protein [Nocardia abscessus]